MKITAEIDTSAEVIHPHENGTDEIRYDAVQLLVRDEAGEVLADVRSHDAPEAKRVQWAKAQLAEIIRANSPTRHVMTDDGPSLVPDGPQYELTALVVNGEATPWP